jgi:hypothetical protein
MKQTLPHLSSQTLNPKIISFVVSYPSTLRLNMDANMAANMDADVLHRLMTENFLDPAQMRIVRQVNREFSQSEIQQGLPVVSKLESLKTDHSLKLALSQGLRLKVDNITSLVSSGRLELLKYLNSNKYFSMLRYIKTRDDDEGLRFTSKAASGGYLETLKWLHENGCSPGCSLGSIESCSIEKPVCVSAAEGGHLECLKWARQNGCPWDRRTRISATMRDHEHVVKWARENGCPS